MNTYQSMKRGQAGFRNKFINSNCLIKEEKYMKLLRFLRKKISQGGNNEVKSRNNDIVLITRDYYASSSFFFF